MIKVSDLTLSYGAHRALENVSLEVDRGEICVILGANGAGKSSLLKAIAGMEPTTNGTRIDVNGLSIVGLSTDKIVETGLALVPEGRGIFGDLTVAENLKLGAYAKRARASEKQNLDKILQIFPKLAERRTQIARTMSGGEQQMVAIGRALMSNPDILMLDEPSLGLSPLLTKELFKSLRDVRDSGVGILLVEQNAKQSLAIADRGYLMENGHITGQGPAAQLANDPAVQAAYLGGATPKQQTPMAGLLEVEDMGETNTLGIDAAALAARAHKIQIGFVKSKRIKKKAKATAQKLKAGNKQNSKNRKKAKLAKHLKTIIKAAKKAAKANAKI
ncbi:MAG: ABC transporter ATP-binding protein [Rhizobiales bacterium]|nr:ABC transporter ATP-binding protein [Hyphomicrobiales bacterium]